MHQPLTHTITVCYPVYDVLYQIQILIWPAHWPIRPPVSSSWPADRPLIAAVAHLWPEATSSPASLRPRGRCSRPGRRAARTAPPGGRRPTCPANGSGLRQYRTDTATQAGCMYVLNINNRYPLQTTQPRKVSSSVSHVLGGRVYGKLLLHQKLFHAPLVSKGIEFDTKLLVTYS